MPDIIKLGVYRMGPSKREREQREDNGIPPEDRVLFLEIFVPDASEFSADLHVCGLEVGSHQVLRAESAAVANGIAAFLLYLRDRTAQVPHAYFNWSEGNPVLYMIRYVLSGYGDVAPITREVLRQAEHNPARRPRIHARDIACNALISQLSHSRGDDSATALLSSVYISKQHPELDTMQCNRCR